MLVNIFVIRIELQYDNFIFTSLNSLKKKLTFYVELIEDTWDKFIKRLN